MQTHNDKLTYIGIDILYYMNSKITEKTGIKFKSNKITTKKTKPTPSLLSEHKSKIVKRYLLRRKS